MDVYKLSLLRHAQPVMHLGAAGCKSLWSLSLGHKPVNIQLNCSKVHNDWTYSAGSTGRNHSIRTHARTLWIHKRRGQVTQQQQPKFLPSHFTPSATSNIQRVFPCDLHTLLSSFLPLVPLELVGKHVVCEKRWVFCMNDLNKTTFKNCAVETEALHF